jgi:protoheme ferro-lyase
MKFNLKYLTPLFSLMTTIIISSCSDKTMFKREIKKCAKVSKPGLLSVYQWQNNFHYMYEQANLDSMLITKDSLLVLFHYFPHYSGFSIRIYAKEWEYNLWSNHFNFPLKTDYNSNFYNNPVLIFMLNRKDSINLNDTDKMIATKVSKTTILMLCTKDSKGKLKREIICN